MNITNVCLFVTIIYYCHSNDNIIFYNERTIMLHYECCSYVRQSREPSYCVSGAVKHKQFVFLLSPSIQFPPFSLTLCLSFSLSLSLSLSLGPF